MKWEQVAGWGYSVNRSYQAESSSGVWVITQLFRSQRFALYGPDGKNSSPVAYGGLRELKRIAEGK